MLDKLKKLKDLKAEKFVLRFFTTWCMVSIYLVFAVGGKAFTQLEAYSSIGLIKFAAAFIIFYALFTVVAAIFKNKKTDVLLLPVMLAVYIGMLISDSKNYYVAFGLIALTAILIFYYSEKGYLTVKKEPGKKTLIIGVAAFAAAFTVIVGTIGVLRYVNFGTPNYDFGIFCNMYYNMRDSFSPVTTCERDELLSHFAVHVSPIYYVLLPFYWLFPSPATLQLSQVIVLASAVAPLALLCKKYGLSNAKTLVMSGVLMFFPAVSGGTSYDFHENCFLLPLLLWMFYFFEKEKYIPMAVFAVLTLTVKEDAAVYVIFFGLYVLLSRKKYLTGLLLMIGAAIYFGGTLLYLSKYGDGVMANRYANFIVGDEGLFSAVKNVLVNPGYVFTQLFVDGDGNTSAKILFLLQMLVPLAFLPFGVKKVSRLLLLLPMILLNLMTLYVYQFDIGFQYSFGVIAFLFYLSVINVSEMKPQTSRTLLSVALAASVMLFWVKTIPSFFSNIERFASGKQDYKIMREALGEIPEDASVICSTYLLPHLSEREVVYEVHYHVVRENEDIDYVILDTRYKYEEFEEKYEQLGYEVTETVANGSKQLIKIMQKAEQHRHNIFGEITSRKLCCIKAVNILRSNALVAPL